MILSLIISKIQICPKAGNGDVHMAREKRIHIREGLSANTTVELRHECKEQR